MELFWHFHRQKCLVIAEKNWGRRILSEIIICSELYQTSIATVTITEACIIEHTMQFLSCLCIDSIFKWEHNYKLWSNCVIYPVTSICYPVWMPWNKYQCMKCHWFMCLWLGWAIFVLRFRAMAFCHWRLVPRSINIVLVLFYLIIYYIYYFIYYFLSFWFG